VKCNARTYLIFFFLNSKNISRFSPHSDEICVRDYSVLRDNRPFCTRYYYIRKIHAGVVGGKDPSYLFRRRGPTVFRYMYRCARMSCRTPSPFTRVIFSVRGHAGTDTVTGVLRAIKRGRNAKRKNETRKQKLHSRCSAVLADEGATTTTT